MEKIWALLLCVYLNAYSASAQGGKNSTEVVIWDEFKGILPPAIIAQLNNSLALEDEVEDPAEAGPKVAHGTPVTQGSYPHQVSLRLTNENNRHFCGASVIHPLLLLSAAHCFESYRPPHIEAVTGEHNLKTSDGKEQVRNVTHLIVHEKYNKQTWDNDVAILVLNESLTFDDYVRPIRLRDPKSKLPSTANVSGWGLTHLNGPSPDILMSAEIKIQDHEDCTVKFKRSNLIVTDNTICAGGYRDACQGDSGGPLTCAKYSTSEQQQRYLCGIVSWGVHCGSTANRRYPGVYTDVSKYDKWIRKHTRPWWKHYWITQLGQTVGPEDGDCGRGNFRCPTSSGLCIPETFKCDGENDCHPMDNDSDERNCGSVTCRGSNFQCNSTRKCLPPNYFCDGDDDCGDNSDEASCT